MKKQSKLHSRKPRAKRPKSVLRKAWETRRLKAAANAAKEAVRKYDPKAPLVVDRDAFLAMVAEDMAALPKEDRADTANDNQSSMHNQASMQTKASQPIDWKPMADGIARTIEIHRDEQLLAFMGEIAAQRESGRNNGHYPWLVSRPQIDAIEEFLSDHGYSAWGKGSGRFMSVSTKPETDKAA